MRWLAWLGGVPERPDTIGVRAIDQSWRRAAEVFCEQAMWSAPVPQRPPVSRAPRLAQVTASGRYWPGVMPLNTQFGGVHWPVSA